MMGAYTREEMTRSERIRYVKTMVEAHQWRQERVNKTGGRNPQAKHYARVLWEAGVLDRSAISRLIGVSRPTVYSWLPREAGELSRLRGPKDFKVMRYLLTSLEAREQGEKLDWGQVTGDLRASGMPPALLRFLCGPGRTVMGTARTQAYEQRRLNALKKRKAEKKSTESKPAPAPEPPEESGRDTDDLRSEVRPDDQGHPDESKDFVVNLYKDPIDHGPGYGEEQSESDHSGDVRGAAARGSDADTESAEGKSGVADNGLVDPATLSDAQYIAALENGSTWVQEGRMPFDVEPVDLDGDSYLADLPQPPSGDGLVAKFQAWEQVEDA